jgi:phosphoglycerol transferase MdoB-like AlkP superfamily enzyme
MIDIFLRLLTYEVSAGLQPESMIRPNLVSAGICALMVVFIAGLGRLRKLAYVLLYIIWLYFGFAQLIYYKIFGKFFWFRDMLMAGDAAAYSEYVLEQIDLPAIAMLACCLGLMVLTLKFFIPKLQNRKKWAIILLVAIAATYFSPWILGTQSRSFRAWRKARNVYDDFNNQAILPHSTGLFLFVSRDIYLSIFQKTDYKILHQEINDYFANKKAHEDNEYTGLIKGKNIIMVMMETGDRIAISDKFTPNIKYMMENGINFTDFYAPIYSSSGVTFNTEFTSLTGFHSVQYGTPLSSLQAQQFPYSLPRLLAKEGYYTQYIDELFHSDYNRSSVYKTFFDSLYFMKSAGISEKIAGFDSRVLDVPEIAEHFTHSEPFLTFFATNSGHLPNSLSNPTCGDFTERFPELDVSSNEDYYCLRIQINDTDHFFGKLLAKLENDGILNDTVIIGFADHYAYGYHNELDKREAGKEEKSPFFIYGSGVPAMVVDKPGTPADIAPTVLNLLGVQTPIYYLGNDLLSTEHNGVVYFNSSFYDGQSVFMQADTPSDKIDTINALLERRKINDLIIKSDYFATRNEDNE